MNHKALKNDFNVSYRTKSAPSGTDKAFGKSPAARPISNRNPICSAQKSLEPTAKYQDFYDTISDEGSNWIKYTNRRGIGGTQCTSLIIAESAFDGPVIPGT